MNDSWKKQFQPWILERGKTYHQMGRVHRLTHHGQEISAVVEGTKVYQVSVRFSTGMPDAASCTCPYASKGDLCKHMAALLFELEALDYTPEDEPAILTWEEALKALPAETLRVVLRNLAEQNSGLQKLLMQLYEYQEMMAPEETMQS